MTLNRVRDFIYVDIERLKSIISQVESGIIEKVDGTTGRQQSASGSMEAGILGLLKGSSEAEVIMHRNVTETKSLHDYIYNKVELSLIERQLLQKIPDEKAIEYSENLRNELGHSSYILVRGKVNINDFGQIKEYMTNFKSIAEFLGQCSVQNLDLNKKDKKAAIKERTEKIMGNLDETYLNGLEKFIDLFYQDRVIIKIIPYNSNAEFRFVGNISPEYLRDDINSITYKYGTAPVSEWTIFGQIASIPPKDRSHQNLDMSGSPIEVALQKMFDSLRNVELTAQSVSYPEIAITPIAIYRE